MFNDLFFLKHVEPFEITKIHPSAREKSGLLNVISSKTVTKFLHLDS